MLALLLPMLGPIIDKLTSLIPDPTARAKAQAEATTQLIATLTTADAAQTDINKVEASSTNMFVAGWRPFIGWVCGAAFAWNFIGLPAANFIVTLVGYKILLAPADLSQMMPVLIGMLGLGTMRSFEKSQGVSQEVNTRIITKTVPANAAFNATTNYGGIANNNGQG